MYRPNGMDSKCQRCTLCTGKSIHGQSNVPMDRVLLLLVSAYPSTEEVKQGITLAPSPKLMNAGKYCRMALGSVFDSDPFFEKFKPFEDRVFFTNAIRCSPLVKKEKKEVKRIHLDTCRYWLDKEISHINDGVPILLASSEAVKSMLGFKESLYSNRRKVFTLYKNHPAVVTTNPIEPARYHPKDVKVYKKRKGGFGIKESFMMKPFFGSPPYWFKQDLLLVKDLVKKYIEDHDISIQ